jgi:hypothetical protein
VSAGAARAARIQRGFGFAAAEAVTLYGGDVAVVNDAVDEGGGAAGVGEPRKQSVRKHQEVMRHITYGSWR